MDAPLLALLNVSPEVGVSLLDGILWQVAIDKDQRLFEPWAAVRFGLDDGIYQVPGAGEDRPKIFTGDSFSDRLNPFEDEKRVGSGGQATLDGEEVSQRVRSLCGDR